VQRFREFRCFRGVNWFIEMKIVDTHSHIYLDKFAADREAMLARAAAAGVEQILLPAIDSETHEQLLDLAAKYPGKCLAMMGLHPCSVIADPGPELALIEEYLGRQPFYAVGEIGLDFYWDRTYTEQQFRAFRHQIELALQYKLPISIHSRNATDEAIAVVQEYVPRGLRGVFHCFSGTPEQARAAADTGFYLGIGGVITFRNGGLDTALADIGLEHIVLETDAPYLAPAPYRGKRNEPSYLSYVVARLAELKGISGEEVAQISTANAEKLFGL